MHIASFAYSKSPFGIFFDFSIALQKTNVNNKKIPVKKRIHRNFSYLILIPDHDGQDDKENDEKEVYDKERQALFDPLEVVHPDH